MIASTSIKFGVNFLSRIKMFLLIFILIFLSRTFISTPSKIGWRTNIYDFGFYNSDPKGIL